MSSPGEEYANEVARVASARKKAKSLKPLREILPFLKPFRGRIAIAGVALVISSAATLILPAAGRQLIDHGFDAKEIGRISQYFLAFLAVAAVMGLSAATRFYFVTWLGERVVADIRKAVFNNVLGLSPEFFEVTRTGEVLSRLTADTTLIQTVVGSTVSVALRNLVTLTGAFVLMFVTSPKLAALVVGAVVMVLIPLIFFGRWVRTLSRKSQDRIADTSAHASETLHAVQTVQAFTHESFERAQFSRVVESSFEIAIRRTRARAVMAGVVIFAVFAAMDAVGWVGARDVVGGTMTPGLLVQFIFYAVLSAGGVGALSEVWGELQRAAGASERLMELLKTEPLIAAPAHPKTLATPARGAVSFQNITFRYPSRPDHKALDNFSLAIQPGEAVALVGPSGAGKSTTLQLLPRFFEAQQGTLTFDGVDVAELDPKDLREHIAIVAQDPVIFSGTIADNIRYGRPDASDDDVRRAADAAVATEFVERLPNGFQTLVGERGTTLSGGQRQRIAIARAILREAPLRVLDEATSALDAENERLVQQGLANLMAGRTTIVIAHRFSTIQRLKRIVVMEDGKVVGEGSHAELVARGGLYARLADLQFSQSLALAG
mgnify:CR=1 FL=1